MAERTSLLDDASFGSIGAAKRAGSKKPRVSERRKVVLSIAALLMAGSTLMYSFVLRPALETRRARLQNVGLTADEERSRAEQEAQNLKDSKDPRIQTDGA